MLKRIKLGLAVIAGAMAVSIPVVLTAGAAQTFTPDNLPLTKISENNKTVTYGWTPVAGYGYVFKTQATANSSFVVVSRTNDPNVSSVKFSKGSYDYAVGALGEIAIGKASDISTPPPIVPTPTNFRTTDTTQTSITVAWDSVNGATNYKIYRNNNLIGQGAGSNGGFSDSWQDSGLQCGTSYDYSVEAQINSDTSAKATLNASTSACAAPDSQAPTSPTNVAVSNVGQTSADLSWTASTDNVGVDHYNMVRSGTPVSQDDASPFSFTGLTCNTAYSLGVQAEDAAGNKSGVVGVNITTLACSGGGGNPETITPSQFQSRAVAGATIDNVIVTGSVTISVVNLTLSNSTVQGHINLSSTANGTKILNSRAVDFVAHGSDNNTLTGNVFDGGPGSSCQNFIWSGANNNPSSGWTITGNTFKNYQCENPHSEALYIASAASNGLIEGNVFTNNGSTSHIFFTWCSDQGGSQNFCAAYGQGNTSPHDWAVRGNTFYDTWRAYYAISIREELTNNGSAPVPGLNICVDNHQNVTGPIIDPPDYGGNLADFIVPWGTVLLASSCVDPR